MQRTTATDRTTTPNRAVSAAMAMLAMLAMFAFTAAPAQAQALTTLSLELVPDTAGDGQVTYQIVLDIPSGVPVAGYQFEVLFDSAVLENPVCAQTGPTIACNGALFVGGNLGGGSLPFGETVLGSITWDLVAGAPPQASAISFDVIELIGGPALEPVDNETVDSFVSVNGYAGGPEPAVSSLNPPTAGLSDSFLDEAGLSPVRLIGATALLGVTLAAMFARRRSSATA